MSQPEIGEKVAEIRLDAIRTNLASIPVAVAVLLVRPNNVTAMLAAFVIVCCYADVYMVCRLRKFDRSMWIVDHPTESGFDVCAGVPESSPASPQPEIRPR
jgi:hypothetical protein